MSVVARALRPIATMFPCKGYPLIDGRLAQRLERSPHTREVKGSNPLSPTIPLYSLICCACGIKKRKFPCVQKHIFLVEALSGVQDKAPWVPRANLFIDWLPINMGESGYEDYA